MDTRYGFKYFRRFGSKLDKQMKGISIYKIINRTQSFPDKAKQNKPNDMTYCLWKY